MWTCPKDFLLERGLHISKREREEEGKTKWSLRDARWTDCEEKEEMRVSQHNQQQQRKKPARSRMRVLFMYFYHQFSLGSAALGFPASSSNGNKRDIGNIQWIPQIRHLSWWYHIPLWYLSGRTASSSSSLQPHAADVCISYASHVSKNLFFFSSSSRFTVFSSRIQTLWFAHSPAWNRATWNSILSPTFFLFSFWVVVYFFLQRKKGNQTTLNSFLLFFLPYFSSSLRVSCVCICVHCKL